MREVQVSVVAADGDCGGVDPRGDHKAPLSSPHRVLVGQHVALVPERHQIADGVLSAT